MLLALLIHMMFPYYSHNSYTSAFNIAVEHGHL